MAIFVRRKRTCEVGWTRAGFTRRMATLVWASGFLLTNGSLGDRMSAAGITRDDLLPVNATNEDVAKLHDQLADWFNYWSARYPQDNLEQAMLNLLVRLVKAKKGWVDERQDQFPFGEAIKAASAGKLEKYIDGKI